MNVNDIFPSKYVKAHDLGGKDVTVSIRSATLEDMGHGAERERKLVLWFERATKGLVTNRTNAMIIASMYGPETDNWIGKAITIYSARVKAFGAWHDAVRVKEQIPARNVGAARIPDAMQEAPPIEDEEDLLDVDEGQEPRRIDPATGEILEPAKAEVDFGMGSPSTPLRGTAQNGTVDKLATLRRERLHTEMSDLEHNHEKRELTRIDAEIAKLEQRPGYAHLIDKLSGDCLERANRARQIHAQSRGPASSEQYQFLAGTIDKIVKQDGAHNAILEVFVGRAVNSENPPGIQLAGKLLDALLEERTVVDADGEKGKEANPHYKADAVACIHSVYKLVREQDGQASLFEPGGILA